jgi:MFS family permease
VSKLRSRIAVSVFFSLYGFCSTTWASRIPALQEKLHLSEAELGTILCSIPVGSVLSIPFAAWAVSKFGSRRVLNIAVLVYVLILLLIGLVETRFQLLAVFVCFGGSSNTVNVSLNTQAVQSETIYDRPIVASFHGLWGLAGFFGAAIGTVMIGAHISPAMHFLMPLGLCVLGVALEGRHLLPHHMKHFPEHIPADVPSDMPPNIPSALPSPTVRKFLGFVLPDKSIIRLGLMCLCVMVCEGAMFDWSGIFFVKVLHAKGLWVGAGFVAFMAAMTATRFMADGLKLRYGFDFVIRCSGVAVFVGFIVSVSFPHLITSTLGFLLIGAGVSSVVPLVFSEAGKSKTMSPSAAIAAIASTDFFGFVLGPPLIGWVAAATSLRVSFAAVAFLGLAIVGLTIRPAPEPRPRFKLNLKLRRRRQV